jgi:hypothetical protein
MGPRWQRSTTETDARRSEDASYYLGVGLAKNGFRLHGCDARGKAVLRKRVGGAAAELRREFTTVLGAAMEACATAHY